MVDVLGHLAMGLLVATPAWLLWSPPRVAAFLVAVLPAALFPDVDLYLPGIPHHGATHTLAFVVGVALVGAALAAAATTALRRRVWFLDPDGQPDARAVFGFVLAGLVLGGASHLLMDLLSTAAWERVVNPFWPFFRKPFAFYYIEQFSSPRWNGRLLVVAVVVHLLMLYREALVTGRERVRDA